MARSIQRYAKRIALYFLPQVEGDGLVLEIWNLIPEFERPQDVFRRAVLLGLREMAANGQIPEQVLKRNNIRERLARHLPPAFMAPVAPAPAPAMLQVAAHPAPVPVHLPVAERAMVYDTAIPEEAEEEPDIDAMLMMMGNLPPMERKPA